MNRVGYDAMAVGNHEFDFGRERLEPSRRQARFPFLSANVEDGGRPAFEPLGRADRRRRPRRDSRPHDARRRLLGNAVAARGLRFLDSVEAARREVAVLRGRERCDLVVVLVHEGFERDLETGADRGSGREPGLRARDDGPWNRPPADGPHAHRHRSAKARRRMGVAARPLRKDADAIRRVARARRPARWTVTEIRGQNLPMKSVAADPEIVTLAAPSHDAAMAALGEPVARLAAPVSRAIARTEDTALLDWLHAVQRERGKADLSFASLLPGVLPNWPAGALTVRQVWSFYPYENTLVTVRATGRQVRQALERAALCFSGLEPVRDGVAWRRNPAVWGYNCDTMDGAEYALDPTRPEGERLLFLRRGGRDVSTTTPFSSRSIPIGRRAAAATRSGDPVRASSSRRSLRDLLIEDARRKGELAPKANENWFLAPSLPEGPIRPRRRRATRCGARTRRRWRWRAPPSRARRRASARPRRARASSRSIPRRAPPSRGPPPPPLALGAPFEAAHRVPALERVRRRPPPPRPAPAGRTPPARAALSRDARRGAFGSGRDRGRWRPPAGPSFSRRAARPRRATGEGACSVPARRDRA